MTTAALEKKTGVSRTTIYFYIRRGLLPAPHRTATGRSLYGEEHVAMLREIARLKDEGRPLAEIKKALEEELSRAQENGADLAALEAARVRAAIIDTASEEFVAAGYRGTHVMTIIEKLGINPHIFYRHFPSKFELLLECFKAAVPLPLDQQTWEERDETRDLGEDVLRGLTTDGPWLHLSGALAEAIRTDGPKDPETRRHLAEVWDAIIVNPLRSFAQVRKGSRSSSPVSEELLVYSLYGAHRTASLRASWDDKYSSEDLLRAHLFVFFALIAAISGETDVDARVAQYEGRIRELAAKSARLPPPL